jgi:hypothetical protein
MGKINDVIEGVFNVQLLEPPNIEFIEFSALSKSTRVGWDTAAYLTGDPR